MLQEVSVMYSVAAAEEILEDIKAGKYKNKSAVYGILQNIVNDCEGTYVADAAKAMLKEYFS